MRLLTQEERRQLEHPTRREDGRTPNPEQATAAFLAAIFDGIEDDGGEPERFDEATGPVGSGC